MSADPKGIGIDWKTLRVGVDIGDGVAIAIALSPSEMRQFADQLRTAACEFESRAKAEAEAAISKAGGRLQ